MLIIGNYLIVDCGIRGLRVYISKPLIINTKYHGDTTVKPQIVDCQPSQYRNIFRGFDAVSSSEYQWFSIDTTGNAETA